MLTALAACLRHGWECLYLQREVETSHLTYQGKTLAVLPAASECKEQAFSERGDVRGEEGRPSLQESEAAGGPARPPGLGRHGGTRRPRGLRQTSALQQGGHGTAMHVPYIQASQKNTELEPTRVDAAPVPGREGAPLLGRALAPGWCAFILLSQPLHLGVQKAGVWPPGFPEKRL